jgi:predicted RNA binding protein YcfA (HicA-like mRNA interferase family)
MKLPRDVSAGDLEKALRRHFDYQFTRQVGSHRRLTCIQPGGQQHLTVPAHNPLKPGTLRAILGDVAEHQHMSVESVLAKLEL